MTIKLWYQSYTAFDTLPGYREALERHGEQVLPPSSEATFHSLPASIYGSNMPGQVLGYPYLKHMVQDSGLEFCCQAEKSGVDAFIIGSFSEPLLYQARSAVDIPVISLPESSLFTACSLGERMALITVSPKQTRRVEEIVQRHRLEARVSDILDMGGRFSELDLAKALEKPDTVLDCFHELARKAVVNGADVVIAAEGVFNEVVYSNGIFEIDGATVLDCVGVSLLHAEMMVRAKRAIKLKPGRAWTYPHAPAELAESMRKITGRDN